MGRKDGTRRRRRAAGGGGSPQKEVFGPSSAQVRYAISDADEKRTIDNQITQVFGRRLNDRELASMVGAPDDAIVTLGRGYERGEFGITIHSPLMDARRTISKDRHGNVVMHNDIFTVKKEAQGKGVGTAVFGRQVEQAQKLGVTKIETSAARSQTFNGYYTWARMGYDAPLTSRIREQLPRELARSTRVSDLMRSKEGQKWWEKHGEWTEMEFDLKAGSRSWETHRAYLKERAARPPRKS